MSCFSTFLVRFRNPGNDLMINDSTQSISDICQILPFLLDMVTRQTRLISEGSFVQKMSLKIVSQYLDA